MLLSGRTDGRPLASGTANAGCMLTMPKVSAMTVARELIAAHPLSRFASPDLPRSIELCFECAQACTTCSDACLAEPSL